MVTRGCFTKRHQGGGQSNQMNKSSLDSERVKGGRLKKDGGRFFARIQATLFFFFKSSPVMLKSLIFGKLH